MNKHFLTDEEFFSIYSKVPRLNVDLVIKSPEGILMVFRTIEPNKNMWHLPGGTVYKEEKIEEAAVRVAKKETGLDCTFVQCLGYMEFPKEMRSGVSIHTISIVIEMTVGGGELRHDEHAKELTFFKEVPENVITEHGAFVR